MFLPLPFFLSFLPPYSFFVSFSSSSSYFLLHSVTAFKDAWLTVPLIREINSPVRGALCVVNTYFPQHDSHAASALIQAPATLLSEELAASEKTRLKKTLFHFTLNSSHTWEDKGRFMDELRPKNLAVVEQRPWMRPLCSGSPPSAPKATIQPPKTRSCPASFVPLLASEWLLSL